MTLYAKRILRPVRQHVSVNRHISQEVILNRMLCHYPCWESSGRTGRDERRRRPLRPRPGPSCGRRSPSACPWACRWDRQCRRPLQTLPALERLTDGPVIGALALRAVGKAMGLAGGEDAAPSRLVELGHEIPAPWADSLSTCLHHDSRISLTLGAQRGIDSTNRKYSDCEFDAFGLIDAWRRNPRQPQTEMERICQAVSKTTTARGLPTGHCRHPRRAGCPGSAHPSLTRASSRSFEG